jgi:hypothetical protein
MTASSSSMSSSPCCCCCCCCCCCSVSAAVPGWRSLRCIAALGSASSRCGSGTSVATASSMGASWTCTGAATGAACVTGDAGKGTGTADAPPLERAEPRAAAALPRNVLAGAEISVAEGSPSAAAAADGAALAVTRGEVNTHTGAARQMGRCACAATPVCATRTRRAPAHARVARGKGHAFLMQLCSKQRVPTARVSTHRLPACLPASPWPWEQTQVAAREAEAVPPQAPGPRLAARPAHQQQGPERPPACRRRRRPP